MKLVFEVTVEFDEKLHPQRQDAFEDIAEAAQDGYGFPDGVAFSAKKIEPTKDVR